MNEDQDQQSRRKRRHGAKNPPEVAKHHNRHLQSRTQREGASVLPDEMREVVTDAGTFIFDDMLSPSISYFLFRPGHEEFSEVLEQNMLAGDPLNYESLAALHYIAELRLSDGWETLVADLYIDRDLVEDDEVQDIVESAMVLLDEIEPGPEGTTLTVFWMQEIGAYEPSAIDYQPPVASLLEKGEPASGEWEDVTKLGITEADIPELIRMVTDKHLHWSEDSFLCFAPVHAWRALGQLRAEQAIYPLITLFDLAEEMDDDYIENEMETVFSMIGAPAVQPLVDFVEDPEVLHSDWAHVSAISALVAIGLKHPDARDQVKIGLRSLLEIELERANSYMEDEEPLIEIDFLVAGLAELGAAEAMPFIREAFARGLVSEIACGSLEDVEQQLKLAQEKDVS